MRWDFPISEHKPPIPLSFCSKETANLLVSMATKWQIKQGLLLQIPLSEKGASSKGLPGVFHNATVKKEIPFLPFPAVKRQLLTTVLKARGLRRNNQPEVRRTSCNTFMRCSPAGNNGCQGLSPTFNSNSSPTESPMSEEVEGSFRSYERERKRLPNQ